MNYHLFVVDEISLKCHIEYGFVGTGNSNNNFNIGLWKDIARLQINDKIIFYVQKTKKFYGFFKVSSLPFYDNSHYLQPNILPFLGDNNVTLQYRALISPDIIFPNGVDEFNLIDILPNNVTDILWSILYRKLKGGRGCSPLFKNEFNIIYNIVSNINNNTPLLGNNYSFSNSQIITSINTSPYAGQGVNPNIKAMILTGQYIESHLHSLLIQNFPNLIFNNIQWLGNEVYSGAGMQAIDILSVDTNNIFNIIEVKKDEIPPQTTSQVFKYIQWLQNRFQNFNAGSFQPIVIGYKISGIKKKQLRYQEFINFNSFSNVLALRYFEYEINNGNIIFKEIDYNNNWQIINQVII